MPSADRVVGLVKTWSKGAGKRGVSEKLGGYPLLRLIRLIPDSGVLSLCAESNLILLKSVSWKCQKAGRLVT